MPSSNYFEYKANTIIITELGLNSLVNATNDGITIRPIKFVLGDSSEQVVMRDNAGNIIYEKDSSGNDTIYPEINIAEEKKRTGIIGNVLYTGAINFCSLIETRTVQFILDLPPDYPRVGDTNAINDSWQVRELGVYLESDIFFARGVFRSNTDGFTKSNGIGIKIYAVLTLDDSCPVDLTSLKITIGDYISLPSVPFCYILIDPRQAQLYPVVVNDMLFNYDFAITDYADYSPGLAIKYGPGNSYWAFLGYDRIYSGNVVVLSSSVPILFTLTQTDPTKKLLSDIVKGNTYDKEYFLIYVVSGTGQGQTRRYRLLTDNTTFPKYPCYFQPLRHGVDPSLTDPQESFLALANDSYVCVWRKSSFNVINMYTDLLPSREGIPPNWVLIRGETVIRWAPPELPSLNVCFYTPPGLLDIVNLMFTTDGIIGSYRLDVVPSSIHYIIVYINGVTQSRFSYDVYNDILMFGEVPPANMIIDVTVFTRVPNTGTKLTVKKFEFTTGAVLKDQAVPPKANTYPFSPAPSDEKYLHVSLSGLKQFRTSYIYTYDDKTKTGTLSFVEKPRDGISLEITVFLFDSTSKEATGHYSDVHTYLYQSYEYDLDRLRLPIVPFDSDYLLVSVSGLNIHKKEFSIVNGVLLFGTPILRGRPITVTIFEDLIMTGTPATSLDGVVLDGAVTSDTIHLLRSNKPPVSLPIPRVNLLEGDGIIIDGCWPDFRISTKNQAEKQLRQRYSTTYTLEDVEEAVFPYRLYFSTDLTVTVSVDFILKLGPGFVVSKNGGEVMEYVLGFKTSGASEPPYGRSIRGTGQAGVVWLPKSTWAYSNASVTQMYDIVLANNPTGFIDFVAKMRFRNGNISTYPCMLHINFNLLAIPT